MAFPAMRVSLLISCTALTLFPCHYQKCAGTNCSNKHTYMCEEYEELYTCVHQMVNVNVGTTHVEKDQRWYYMKCRLRKMLK
jgi:hypothetical protein